MSPRREFRDDARPRHSIPRALTVFLLSLAVCWLTLEIVDRPIAGTFRPATLLDPLDGLYRTARLSDGAGHRDAPLAGLETSVQVVRDERGVPHLFAGSDRDAVTAFGYVVAQDRLFQMDFLRRYTSGRLSEVLGKAAVPVDLSMRRTGIERSVRANLEASDADGRMTGQLFEWFADGVNAWVDGLEERDLPFEFRLFNYRPERFTRLDPGLIGWNLVYDLTYQREAAVDVDRLAGLFPPGEYARLFPRYSVAYRPIVPEEEAWWRRRGPSGIAGLEAGGTPVGLMDPTDQEVGTVGAWGVGFVDGKGSNNWAVSGERSATGAPILAGDMHLSLTLPAIWYEVHMVTPTMDTYGVTVPGIPLPIEAFNRHLGWAFTNTGSDQIDHLALELDDTGTSYRYEGAWRPLVFEPFRLAVRGSDAVEDSIAWSHFGPVTVSSEGTPTAVRWVGNDTLRTFDALWLMNHATDYASFETALRSWDAPMQNILYAGMDGRVAIRSTGYLPLRADGGSPGLRDGSVAGSEWVGRVPFEDLPYVVDPARGYLTSTNQQPADPSYPYYLGSYGPSAWRSLRIDRLLASRERHTLENIASYQSDAVAVAGEWLSTVLSRLPAQTSRAESLRVELAAWNGEMATDRFEPVAYDVLISILADLAWDEPVFKEVRRPGTFSLLHLLGDVPEDPWLDRVDTTVREDAEDLLALALAATADSLDRMTGGDWETLAWGDQHTLLLRHITMTPALSVLWRGPYAFRGTYETLSPGPGRRVTFGASWRVVLDFSEDRPVGTGIYAGGASGNPFGRFYDGHVDDFLSFRRRPLRTPGVPTDLPDSLRSGSFTLLTDS